MSNSRLNHLLDHVRKTLLGHDGAGLTDAKLLERFVVGREEAAFAALVRRHGGLVWGVCRRVLSNHHDAEDAFQATFLVLARKAASIKAPSLLANWLFGVAQRTAHKLKSANAHRQARERQVRDMPQPQTGTGNLWHDLEPILDAAGSRLPDKYRAVILLCDLEGKTRRQAALALGIPQGTVASRLATARDKLARLLTRHGVEITGAALAAVLAGKASAGAPVSLVSATIKAVTLVAAGQATTLLSSGVAALSEGVLQAMFVTKLMRLTLVFVAGLALFGGGLFSYQIASGQWTLAAQQPIAQVPKIKPDANPAQPDAKPTEGEAALRLEIVKLRLRLDEAIMEIKSLKESLGQGTASKEKGQLYQGKAASYWINLLNDADVEFQLKGIRGIGILAEKNKELIPLLVAVVKEAKDMRQETSSTASYILKGLGPEALPALMDSLKETLSPSETNNIVSTIGSFGPKAKAAVPMLIEILKRHEDEDWLKRRNTLGALGKIGSDAKAAIPAIVELLGKVSKSSKPQKDKESDAFNLFSALTHIDWRAMRELFPEEINANGDLVVVPRGNRWQEIYDTLKKHYEK